MSHTPSANPTDIHTMVVEIWGGMLIIDGVVPKIGLGPVVTGWPVSASRVVPFPLVAICFAFYFLRLMYS